jgi:type I restriction enzyme S subunit
MKHEYQESGIPFLRSQNVRENSFDPEGLLYISERFHKQLSKSVLHPGDLAVVRSGAVGVTCVIPAELGEANCSDLVIVQGPRGVIPRFGSYYMNSVAKKLVKAGQVGITLTHFNTRSVASLPVPVPPLAEQHRIVAEVESQLSVINTLETVVAANLKRAERLRQTILRRAFEGKLVPQDPDDESASVLLDRIRAERNGTEPPPRRRAPARAPRPNRRSAAGMQPLFEHP